MYRLLFVPIVVILASCSATPTQITSSEVPDQGTELSALCSVLRADYAVNVEQIEKLEVAMAMDIQEDAVVHIQLTALGASMGAENISSPEQMLVILNAVKLEHEKALSYTGKPNASTSKMVCMTQPGAPINEKYGTGQRLAAIKMRVQNNWAN
jgi:hypothetical protein